MRNHTKTIAGITAAAGIAGAICALLYMQPGPRTPAAAASAPAKSMQTPMENADIAPTAHACDTHAGAAMIPDIVQTSASEAVPAAKHRLPSSAEPVAKPLGEVLRNVGPMDDWREFKPASITIAPLPELEAEFQMESVRTEHDRTIWTGRNPDLPGAFLVTVATKENLHAMLSYALLTENDYKVQASGATAKVMEQPEGFVCGNSDAESQSGRLIAGDFDTKDGNLRPDADMSTAMADTGDVYSVDVLFFYDPSVVIFNTREEVKSWMILDLESANVVLANSWVNSFRWRFVECYEAPDYPVPSGLAGDVQLMANPSTQLGGYIEYKRQQHHADQCMLWVRADRGDGYVGMAELLGIHSVVLYNAGYKTVAHELGHNFGCQHDRLEPSSGAADNDRKHNYAWSIKEPNPNDAENEYYFGTIMSYANTRRYAYFSNPYLPPVYEVLTGTSYQIGVPSGAAKAAYNASVMDCNGPWMSIVGDPPSPPKILAHPRSVTLGVGSMATIRVFVSSPVRAGEVRYKWRTTSRVVQEGTSDSLVVVGASAGKVDVYYVDVSNSAGSVTSNAATVMVSAVDIPTTYSDSGGGSPSLWYLLAIVLLVALRRPRDSRKA